MARARYLAENGVEAQKINKCWRAARISTTPSATGGGGDRGVEGGELRGQAAAGVFLIYVQAFRAPSEGEACEKVVSDEI